MITYYNRDGQEIDKIRLIRDGFDFNEERDFRKKYSIDANTGEKNDSYTYVLDFVGFLVNNNNDIFTVFPKNYRVVNPNHDSSKIFSAIAKHIQQRPDMYLGNEYGNNLKSNYPFAAFFGIYDYFSKYGLYFDDMIFIKPNAGGKINWKDTIRLSDKYITHNKLVFFPIYYEKKYYFLNFLTECMIYAIDYTIDKFGIFIELDKTGRVFPTFDFINQKEFVLESLISLQQQTFKDSVIELIEHLINFFNAINEGGLYYFKHYSFSTVWEDMVMNYLKFNYKEISNNQIVFDENNTTHIAFSKPSFHPNLAKTEQYFTPDYYYADGNTQLIFDAKYYTDIQGIDYKQIAYYLFLNEIRENIDDEPKYTKTYSALLLPSEARSSQMHFKMDPRFNKTNKNLVISEEYLDIHEVIDFYLK